MVLIHPMFVVLHEMNKKKRSKRGFKFKVYEAPEQTPFERLFDIFKELITHTSGDFDEALDWLETLDKEYKLTGDDYSIEDFVQELKDKGYIREEILPNGAGGMSITAKTERAIRKGALEQILRFFRPNIYYRKSKKCSD